MRKFNSLLITAFVCVIVFIILYVPFFSQSLQLIYFKLFLIGIIGVAVSKLLKIKINYDIKKTNIKYWWWVVLLIVFTIAGDFVIGGNYIDFLNIPSIILLPLLIAFSEEIITRVVILNVLSKEFGYKTAIFIQAAVFTLFHFDFRALAIVYYMVFGIGAGLLMLPKKGNFAYPFVAHYVSDAVILAVRFSMP